MVMDDLFDITLETNLVKETKDILDELNIMQCIKRQQDSVLEDFEREMLHKECDAESGFHDSSRLGYHVHELQKSAQATYDAVSLPYLCFGRIEKLTGRCSYEIY
jgi:hypothetical protein